MTRKYIVLTVIALVAACGEKPEALPAPQPNPALQPEQEAPQDPTDKMARAVSPGKPGAAVDLKYEISSKPQPGTPVEIDLAIIPSVAVERLMFKVSGMDGLTLAGDLEGAIEAPNSGQVYDHTFSLVPDRTGIFYATVSIITHSGGSQMGRTFSIPLLVGDAPQVEKTRVAPQPDATGQPVQPMKAEETRNKR